jgi:hypothetical protein
MSKVPRNSKSHAKHFRPRLESLENRDLPSVGFPNLAPGAEAALQSPLSAIQREMVGPATPSDLFGDAVSAGLRQDGQIAEGYFTNHASQFSADFPNGFSHSTADGQFDLSFSNPNVFQLNIEGQPSGTVESFLMGTNGRIVVGSNATLVILISDAPPAPTPSAPVAEPPAGSQPTAPVTSTPVGDAPVVSQPVASAAVQQPLMTGITVPTTEPLARTAANQVEANTIEQAIARTGVNVGTQPNLPSLATPASQQANATPNDARVANAASQVVDTTQPINPNVIDANRPANVQVDEQKLDLLPTPNSADRNSTPADMKGKGAAAEPAAQPEAEDMGTDGNGADSDGDGASD